MQRAPCDEEAFSREVVARWGHLSDSLAFDEGLVHTQMGHLGLPCVARPGSAKQGWRAPYHHRCSLSSRADP